jgi:hypothetical protein
MCQARLRLISEAFYERPIFKADEHLFVFGLDFDVHSDALFDGRELRDIWILDCRSDRFIHRFKSIDNE